MDIFKTNQKNKFIEEMKSTCIIIYTIPTTTEKSLKNKGKKQNEPKGYSKARCFFSPRLSTVNTPLQIYYSIPYKSQTM